MIYCVKDNLYIVAGHLVDLTSKQLKKYYLPIIDVT